MLHAAEWVSKGKAGQEPKEMVGEGKVGQGRTKRRLPDALYDADMSCPCCNGMGL